MNLNLIFPSSSLTVTGKKRTFTRNFMKVDTLVGGGEICLSSTVLILIVVYVNPLCGKWNVRLAIHTLCKLEQEYNPRQRLVVLSLFSETCTLRKYRFIHEKSEWRMNIAWDWLLPCRPCQQYYEPSNGDYSDNFCNYKMLLNEGAKREKTRLSKENRYNFFHYYRENIEVFGFVVF